MSAGAGASSWCSLSRTWSRTGATAASGRSRAAPTGEERGWRLPHPPVTHLSRREGLWRLLELSRKPIFIVFESQYREITHPAITLLKQHRSIVTLLVWRASSMVSAEPDPDCPLEPPFPPQHPTVPPCLLPFGAAPWWELSRTHPHQHSLPFPAPHFGSTSLLPSGAVPQAPGVNTRLGHSPFGEHLKTQPEELWLGELTPQTCMVRTL